MFHLITGGSGSENLRMRRIVFWNFRGKTGSISLRCFPLMRKVTGVSKDTRKMRREKCFTTIECYTGVKNLEISSDSDILLECMSNLTANEMYQENGAAGRRRWRKYCRESAS